MTLVLIGLVLPVLCGSLLIEGLNRKYQWQWHRALRLSLGVLAGYFFVYAGLVALANLPNELLRWLLPAVFAMAALLLWYWCRRLVRDDWLPWSVGVAQRQPRWAIGVTVALALWIAIIWLSAWLEGLSRPVYPWDAWLAWTYRAKAWFYQGGIGTIAAPAMWLSGEQPERYTIDAFDYPRFSSVLQYWTALLAGEWSDYRVSLVAIPAALAGLGAVYGLARDSGSSRLQAVAICYVLASLPLLRTHLALPGYADIWLMAYAGVGLAVLMSGLARSAHSLTVTGLLLLVIGTQIKHEGMVWLYLGVMLLFMETLSLRMLSIALALITGLAGSLWLLGGSLDVPVVGRLGISEGRLWLPGLPPQTLIWYDSLPHYQRNFLQLESWHLLWSVTALLALLSLRSCRQQRVRIALLALGLIGAANVFIFFVSAQGAYASTYTALNRLPLQLTPAVALSLLWLWQATSASQKQKKKGAVAVALAALALGVASLVALTPDLPAPAERELGAWRSMIGNGRPGDNGSYEAISYQNGMALLSSGPVTVDAATLQSLRYEVHGSGEPAAFFWRRAEQPADIVVRDLNAYPSGVLQLSVDRAWDGHITELGFLLYENGAQRQTLSRVALYTPSRWQWLGDQPRSWMTAPRLDQRSINFSSAGSSIRESYPVALAGIVVTLATALGLLARVGAAQSLLIATIPLWLLLDLRWTLLTHNETRAAITHLAHGQPSHSLSDADAWAAQVTEAVRQRIASQEARIAIIHAPEGPLFEALRIKYRLLPTPAITLATTRPLRDAQRIDYMLTLGDLQDALPEGAQPIWSGDGAQLYQLAPRP